MDMSDSSSSQPPNGRSNLAKAIRIALSFVNYSKTFDESTSNDNNLSSTSLNINPKCPGGGNFCSTTSGSKSSSPPSSSSSLSSSSSIVGVRASSSISASGRQPRGGVGVGSRSTGSELPSELSSTLQPTTRLPSNFESGSIKSVNLVDSQFTDYYSDYDPMMGIRIAISLLGIIVLFAIFVVYKSHCNAKKAKRLLPYRGSNRSASGYRTP
ncbi:uncharacterized protein LOC128395845 [Panonychus citri]|uniref:uncharacterized protein LOC128395845 n=1 Tax=Panonychus citri TaxID=50023 RepID=UPI00230822B7|nr:uncharacterized protein LOC128395845 [Panonychus citri]